ncbi:MAG: sulfotransferase domain-containing protein [Chloroflexota bacterium]
MPIKTTLRRLLFRSEKTVQRLRFASLPAPQEGWPVLLGISFPKSGTHLLDQVLLGFSQVAPFSRRLHSFYAEYEGESGRKRPPEQALAWLDSLRPGDVASAHLFARPQAAARVTTPAFAPYFIFRDPRDVAVSHAFYVTDMEPDHVHHAYYRSLPGFDARLKVSILGRPDSGVEFPNIADRFAPYLDWLDHPEVLALHFESLVHERPGTLGLVADHLRSRLGKSLRAPREAVIQALDSAINPARSPTFRSGKTGEWKKHFTDEHKKLFKDVAGELLVRLGYEKNSNW